ncbi:unnamed protein product [Cuscuta campestris]|uniref:F-box domain-containing protein n=1 Tax=Cuscuta campestris TaxID=132261 RepID=A0A484MT81_9ASTE|nr:unnamed protein product [Cuscuta campestris]
MVMEADSQTLSLPQDIVTDILKRLPVKTLIRFQCVCKSWKDLIKSSSFVAEQLHCTTPFLLFSRSRDFSLGHGDCSLGLRLLHCNLQVREELPEPPLIIDPLNHAIVVCSSNGLLCLRISMCRSCKQELAPSLIVWNPVIFEALVLPPTSLIVNYRGNFFVGFGFSPIINDHKVVMIWFSAESFGASRAEVYSLSSCSWKVVECGLLDGMCLEFQTVTANGSMFWIGSKKCVNGDGGTRTDLKIVSFNITTEVFTLIPMPSHSFSFYRLAVCEKKLCLIAAPSASSSSSSPGSGSKIHWWVMEEDRCNWVKKYISCPLSCALSPVTIWKNEIVCYVGGSVRVTEFAGVNDEPNIALLNLTTGGYKLFVFRERYIAINHVESLVPVRGKKYSCTWTS